MVFTHLPSNVLLILVPLMPTLPLAIAVLLARFAISQMDVPTRQSYTIAVVEPDERSAAAGVTGDRPQPGGGHLAVARHAPDAERAAGGPAVHHRRGIEDRLRPARAARLQRGATAGGAPATRQTRIAGPYQTLAAMIT